MDKATLAGMSMPLQKKTAVYWLVSVLMLLVIYKRLMPLESGDMQSFLYPWFSAILAGGYAAMAGDYANYSPPYLYLLGLASLFSPLASPIVLIKSVSIVFTFAGAAVFGLIVMEVSRNRNLALTSACFFPLIPSVAVNAAWWGQCDVIYTTFLLAAFWASIRRAPLQVVIFFGIAFSFKAQAIFFTPYLLYLVLKKELPWRYLLLIPVIYACMMLPAWLAGRPAAELASIYVNQGGYYKSLAMNAPNPWAIIEKYHLMPYAAGVLLGAAATVAASLFLVRKSLLSKYDEVTVKLWLVTMSTLASPYLLPKMHDRYFFPADVFTVLLCVIFPRYRIAAISMQIASVLVALAFLKTPDARSSLSVVASVFSSIALFWLLFKPPVSMRSEAAR
ncbi:hypothetical protein [Noviherbaspirillum suwonense]|uniref:Mannosyltransferase related to Gpi18 n=1 Tax=Noviherbaspirillum suwonense TaxID=1224511 RepID=A0ABY1Q2P9_9BURK|nr:hypothetical protein [Noviherbaspirillum suwonense]SMP56067.1 Mannosyltransferase related to Gpi18 [Noviherbaspirillum suwonense]